MAKSDVGNFAYKKPNVATVYEYNPTTGQSYAFKSPNELFGAGYEWGDVVESSRNPKQIAGSTENFVYKNPNVATVYEYNPTTGESYAFKSANEFTNSGYKWGDVLNTNKNPKDLVSGDKKYVYKNPDVATVYEYDPATGQSYAFKSPDELFKAGYQWGDVITKKQTPGQLTTAFGQTNPTTASGQASPVVHPDTRVRPTWEQFWNPQATLFTGTAKETLRPEFEQFQLNPFEQQALEGMRNLKFAQGIGGGFRTGEAGRQQGQLQTDINLGRQGLEKSFGDVIANNLSNYRSTVAQPEYNRRISDFELSPTANFDASNLNANSFMNQFGSLNNSTNNFGGIYG